ncbi:PTS sugar transporter subunit IIA [bacterium]|nr:PTS sugar transporter subunit IIA [bacterium]
MAIDPKKMFSPSRVADLKSSTKEDVLRELVDVLGNSEQVTDRKELLDRILEREKTLSTGVGIGVALPHVKIPSIKDFVIAVGRSFQGVDFQSIDEKPAHIVVMIGCNESQSGDYLKVLSKLVRALKDGDFRKKILMAKTNEEVVDLFIEAYEAMT